MGGPVGREGADAAYLIAQHAIHDPEFQAEALRLMEEAYRAGEMEGSQVAYLTDRVAVQVGRPQRYGSQFKIRDAVIVIDPIEDSATVDERRAAVGLPPLAEIRPPGRLDIRAAAAVKASRPTRPFERRAPAAPAP